MRAKDGRNANLRSQPDHPDKPDRGVKLPWVSPAAWAGLLGISGPLLPQARNLVADAEDAYAAPGENRIVKMWYTPDLETAGARRTDLPEGLAGVPMQRLCALVALVGFPWCLGASIAAEMALVGLALRWGSSL